MTQPGLLASPSLVQAAIDALAAHVAVVLPTGLVVAVNRAWQHFCTDNGGSEAGCGVGANYFSVCGETPDDLLDAPVFSQGLRAVLRGQLPEFSMTYPCHAPHEQRWFRARVSPVCTGGVVQAAVVAHENITEHELGLMAVQESETRFRALADLLPLGIVVGGMDGTLEYANDSFLALVQTSRPDFEAGAFNWRALTPPEWLPADEQAAREAEACGHSAPYEKEYQLPGGLRVPALLALARFTVAGRERLCGYALDLTERKQQEARLHELNAELEAMVETRTGELMDLNLELRTYAEAVTRDLRPPVTRILGFAGLVRSAAALDERERAYLEHLHREGERVAGLIDDLQHFAVDTPRQLSPSRVPLDALVRQVRSDLTHATRGRRIVWTQHSLPAVMGDPLRLRHALTQLLHNAVKFTRPQPEAHIEIGAQDSGGETVLWVRDNGVGFDPREAARLFQVFTRLHGDAFEGAGVGLANVRRIVRQHGGRVWAQGEPGAGATFSFALPHSEAL